MERKIAVELTQTELQQLLAVQRAHIDELEQKAELIEKDPKFTPEAKARFQSNIHSVYERYDELAQLLDGGA
jgi:hypothetical protein